MSHFLKYLVTLCFLAGSCMAQGGECPSGWAKWKDEKCYLLTTTYSNYDSAKEVCAGNGGTLPTIKEEEQQTFLTNFIFNISEVKMGVWIGANRKSGSPEEFLWEVDGSGLDYTNWGPDSPSSIVERECVAMQSRLSKLNAAAEPEDGKWKDVSCEIINSVVCESIPDWSVDDIKRVLIDTRKELKETKKKLASETERLNNESRKVENLEKNPVPNGFIYIEYHGQPSPQIIWPGVTWTDVTSTYAGLFFRALGGGSAEFGSTQNADCPRLTNVQMQWKERPAEYKGSAAITPGTWSDFVLSGRDSGNWDGTIRYLVSNSEVRPKNAAIRIWKREA